MDFNDLKGMFAEVKTRMDAAIDRVRRDMASVRTGRATVSLLDNVQVEAYGSKVPINQVASLSVRKFAKEAYPIWIAQHPGGVVDQEHRGHRPGDVARDEHDADHAGRVEEGCCRRYPGIESGGCSGRRYR